MLWISYDCSARWDDLTSTSDPFYKGIPIRSRIGALLGACWAAMVRANSSSKRRNREAHLVIPPWVQACGEEHHVHAAARHSHGSMQLPVNLHCVRGGALRHWGTPGAAGIARGCPELWITL